MKIFKENESEYMTAIIKCFPKIFENQISNDNQEFFIALVKNFDSFSNEIIQVKTWRIQSEALNGIDMILEHLHKHGNNYSQTNQNTHAEDFSTRILTFIKYFLNFDNFQIQTVAVALFTKNLKFSKDKEEIIKYSETEFFADKSFYKRRLYLIFFQDCLKVFSINYIKEIGMLQNIFEFFEDTSINICHLISILPEFYPLINDMSDVKFKLLNKLTELRKKEYFDHDKEINRVWNNFNFWEDFFRRNKDSEEFKDMIYQDKMKMDEELKRQCESKLITDGKDKRDDRNKNRRSTIKKNPIISIIKPNIPSINQSGGNQITINNTLFISSNTLHPNFIRKSDVRKDSFIQVQKPDLCNFPIIKRSENKKFSVQETKVNFNVNKSSDIHLLKPKEFFDKKSPTSSYRIKRIDEKNLIEDSNTIKNLSSKEILQKIKIASSSPISSFLSKNINYHSSTKIDSIKNVVLSHKLSLKEPISSNHLSLNQNRMTKSRSEMKDRSSSTMNPKNSYR